MLREIIAAAAVESGSQRAAELEMLKSKYDTDTSHANVAAVTNFGGAPRPPEVAIGAR